MKWYMYIICFVIIVAGAFCGIRLYQLVTAESYINGSINIENKFSMDSFTYANTSVVFYNDIYDETNTYTFSVDLKKVDNFDGAKNKYEVIMNGYVLLDTQISAGTVFSTAYIDFYDTSGDIVCSAYMDISIHFLSNKTALTFTTTGKENASFLEQYFADNGIRLKVVEILNGGK